jgi:hypothetical protein
MANNWNDIVCHASGRDEMGADFGWNLFHAIRSVGKSVGKGLGSVGKQLDKVPVVGKGLHAVYNAAASPLTLTADIASGQNVAKSAVKNFKTNLNAAKDIAPYAMTVVTLVPGIGSGVGAAVAAADALAKGKPISEMLISATRGALPGGPLAQSAFDVVHAAASGQNISNIALSAIPLPPEQKDALRQTIAVASDIAAGKRVDKILLNRVNDNLKYLPKEVQQAAQVGVALGHGKNIQDAMKKAGSPEALNKLLVIGRDRVKLDNVLNAGHSQVSDAMKKGFAVGAGISQFKFSPTELHAVRGKLSPADKDGFDLALSTHVGKLIKSLPANLDPKLKFGYYASVGMKHAKPENQAAMKRVLAKDTHTSKGMLIAKTDVHMSFWDRLKHLITRK